MMIRTHLSFSSILRGINDLRDKTSQREVFREQDGRQICE